eukprot:GHRQ01025640.1.p2 GENE.GHRQ01025640.1~~GHRQ01025640.1.p2  ORF type:complete len:105 (+),score=25.10 GHRQ01025640.1:1489-1803(+)
MYTTAFAARPGVHHWRQTHLHECLPVFWQQQLLWGDAQGLAEPAGEGVIVRGEDGPFRGVAQIGSQAGSLQGYGSRGSSKAQVATPPSARVALNASSLVTSKQS